MAEKLRLPKAIPIRSYVYSVTSEIGGFTVIKWDGLLNIDRIYFLKGKWGRALSCECWRGRFGTGCRHRPIIRLFIMTNRIDKGWFYDFDNDQWYLPLPIMARNFSRRREPVDEQLIGEILSDENEMQRYRKLAPTGMGDRKIAEAVAASDDDNDDDGWRAIFKELHDSDAVTA